MSSGRNNGILMLSLKGWPLSGSSPLCISCSLWSHSLGVKNKMNSFMDSRVIHVSFPIWRDRGSRQNLKQPRTYCKNTKAGMAWICCAEKCRAVVIFRKKMSLSLKTVFKMCVWDIEPFSPSSFPQYITHLKGSGDWGMMYSGIWMMNSQ